MRMSNDQPLGGFGPFGTRKRLAAGLAAVLGLGGLVETAAAATRYVTTCDDSSTPIYIPGQFVPLYPLRYQVAQATSGDTIDMTNLACSTITLTNGEIPITVATLIIKGPTSHTLTIDGNAQGRVFDHVGYPLNHVKPHALGLYNMTITNGKVSGNGGCIRAVSPGTVYLQSVNVTGCSASSQGGGIAAPYVQANQSTISNNAGGGIYAYGGQRTGAVPEDAYIQYSTISGNTGGAGLIGNKAGYLKISNSTIENNTSSMCGGIDAGVSLGNGGTSAVNLSYSNVVGNNAGQQTASVGGICAGSAQLSFSTVSGNKGSFGGVFTLPANLSGGFYDLDVKGSAIADNTGYFGTGGGNAFKARVDSSTISGNVSGNTTGGIIVNGLLSTNTTISGNRGKSAGGLHASGNVKLYNSTIAFNVCADSGSDYTGGVLAASANVSSTIIANNVAGTLNAESDVYSTTLTASNSLIMASNQPNSSITADPQLLPLANNGGSTLTHALGLHSPALGVGSNPKGLGTDERGPGFPRTWANGQVDIGALQTVDEIFKDGFE